MATKSLNVLINGDPAGLIGAFGTSEAAAGGWGAKLQAIATSSTAQFVAGGLAIGAVFYKIGSDFNEAYDKIQVGTGAK